MEEALQERFFTRSSHLQINTHYCTYCMCLVLTFSFNSQYYLLNKIHSQREPVDKYKQTASISHLWLPCSLTEQCSFWLFPCFANTLGRTTAAQHCCYFSREHIAHVLVLNRKESKCSCGWLVNRWLLQISDSKQDKGASFRSLGLLENFKGKHLAALNHNHNHWISSLVLEMWR